MKINLLITAENTALEVEVSNLTDLTNLTDMNKTGVFDQTETDKTLFMIVENSCSPEG